MKRARLRPVSLKRQRLNRLRDRVIPPANGQECEARLDVCLGRATDRHELLSRARGGSIVDPANVVYLCRLCHQFITENPRWAMENGWSRRV